MRSNTVNKALKQGRAYARRLAFRYKANMRIEVTREACCSQDDQLGPLNLQIDLPEESSIWELAREIGEAKFLQFSSPRNVIDAYCAGKLLFSIPVVGASGATVSYAVGRDDLVCWHLKEPKISCVWPGGL